jgi:hypothetical protein
LAMNGTRTATGVFCWASGMKRSNTRMDCDEN